MDAENKGKSFGVGGYRGRVIFLGDGTEVLTDSDDTEMFDTADEDKDLASQVSKASSTDIEGSKPTAVASEKQTQADTPSHAKNKAASEASAKQGEAGRGALESNDKD